MRVLKESFNAGEFSPKLHSRYELLKYKNGCKTLTNMVPLPHGPVVRRPGTYYITEVKTSAKFTRLIPFIFSEDDSYILEFGDQYIRFFRNQGQVWTGDANTDLLLHFDGTNYSTTISDDGSTGHSPTVAGAAKLRTEQKKFGTSSCFFPGSASDYVTVPDHADWTPGSGNFTADCWVRFTDTSNNPHNIFQQRVDGDNKVNFFYNGSTNILYFEVKVSAVQEVLLSYSWTPSVDTWYHVAVVRGWDGNANDWAITIDGAAVETDTVNYTIPDLAAAFTIGDNFQGYIDEFRWSKGTARWTADFTPPDTQYPFGDESGSVYEIATTYLEVDLANLHFVQSGNIMYIVNENYVVRKLTRTASVSWSIADVSFTTPPAEWSANDYPRTIDFYEDRLCFGGSPDQPDTVWTSDSGDYETFTSGGADDAAIEFTLSARQINDIKWISSARRLLIGTGGEEWWVSGPSDTEPITPSNKVAKRDSAWGSERVMPINLGDSVFYLQDRGRILREMRYDFNSDRYISRDLIVLAEHLTRDYQITAMAFQQHPYQVFWCVRSDGTLLSLTYLEDQDVAGWAKHTSAEGIFKSVAVIPGDIEDEVWFVVERTIDGSMVQYIERLKEFNFGSTLSEAYFVDCGLTYKGAAATLMSGLTHLEGENVDILADGVVVDDKAVSSGSLSLDDSASTVHIGLEYVAEVETLHALVQNQNGPLQGYPKRITNVIMHLTNSSGGNFGVDNSTNDPIIYPPGTTGLYNGWSQDMSFKEGDDKTATVYINSDDPLPLEVGAILIDLEEDEE